MTDSSKQNLVLLVEETMRILHDKGIPLSDLAPLVILHDAVTALNKPDGTNEMPPVLPVAPVAPVAPDVSPEPEGHFVRDSRLGELKASEELMARACAIIDVMIQGGDTPEHASQVITRQLIAMEIKLPEHGGDVRAWKRLLSFRNTLIHYIQEGPVKEAYSSFKGQLSGIPPDQRLRRAVGERLWNRRESVFAAMHGATQ